MTFLTKLNEAPTADSLGLALGVRGGLITGQPSESLRQLANLSLLDMAKECCYWSKGGLSKAPDADVVRGAFGLSGGMMANAFDNFFGTIVRQAYAEAEDKTQNLVWETEVENYKPSRVIRVQDEVLLLPRGYQQAALQSLTAYVYEWRAYEYAKMLVVNEQDLIDDQFNAIRSAAQSLGRGPKRLKQDLFFSLLLQNPVLPSNGEKVFSTAHNNILSGESSALGSESLASAIQKIREQTITTPDGIVHCELQPKFLLVPPSLENTGRQCLRLQKLDDRKIDLQLIVTSRISSIGVVDPLTGELQQGTNTNWACFAIRPTRLFSLVVI